MRQITIGTITLALLLAGLAPFSGAQDADPAAGTVPVVLVANSVEGTIDVIDAETFEVQRTIDVIPNGEATFSNLLSDRDPAKTANAIFVNQAAGDNYAQDLDLSPDGETLYVSRGHLADVAAFDLTQTPAELLWTTSVDGFRADHMTISADGERLFVSDLTEYQVLAIDTDDGQRVGTVPTGQYAHGVNVVTPGPAPATASPENEISPDGRCAFVDDDQAPRTCLYAASIGDITLFPREVRAHQPDAANPVLSEPYQLTIADADTLEVLRTLSFPDGIRPADFDLSGDTKTMYYQESMLHGIVEYDLEEGREIRRAQLPVDEGVTSDDYSFESPHHGLALEPDGSTLCAAGRASDYVALVSTETLRPEKIIDVGDAPSWATNGPHGQTCWIANSGSEASDPQPPADTVSVISYADQATIATVPTGSGPKHLLAATLPAPVVG